MEIFYFDEKVKIFIDKLDKKTSAKFFHKIELLGCFGYKIEMPHSKRVCDDLFELRVRERKEIRVFYIFRKNKIILLSGFLKKTQKLPKKEIKKALQKKDEYDII